MNLLNAITAIVALYGAALATFTFVVQQKEKKRSVLVTFSLGFAAYGIGDVKDIIIIEAANSGYVPVHLSSCDIKLVESNKKLAAPFEFDHDFPVTLAPGEGVQARMKSEVFINAMREKGYSDEVKVAARFSNKAGEQYSSEIQTLELEKMLFAKKNTA